MPIEFEMVRDYRFPIVSNEGRLMATLHMVVAAVRAGELDELLAQEAQANGCLQPSQGRDLAA
jgi:hypothetical protein